MKISRSVLILIIATVAVAIIAGFIFLSQKPSVINRPSSIKDQTNLSEFNFSGDSSAPVTPLAA